ncbi:MAG: tRNA epoxyqueuosine(34) reductase QueG [Thermomonas sp.]|uniref:tRNA epoxyqueuosine(34) reductase QueG n=1 Tax=Thermomonas sp. TaxID=1971895 RepID=UPI002609C776|nr:tRNA epoxyqueuosine(34) reductase QueG [Thermomonas sp.]MCC7096267.1 tRNA epoxyqueuosine(34) reductase QueG [Thermomonas sp.]
MSLPAAPIDYAKLAANIKRWAREFGFADAGITDIDLGDAAEGLRAFLAAGHHGDMHWLDERAHLRTHPDELHPGTLRVISLRMDYAPPDIKNAWDVLRDDGRAYISRYSLGRDYHRMIRRRLQRFADHIQSSIGHFGYRVFCDSAPIMEKPLAQKAGLGWRGKHTLTLSRSGGSYFFLGEILTDLPLPIDAPVPNHCGSCTRCIDICPTAAIIAPYKLDARRCITYLNIEHKGSIDPELRPLMGNRIFGCDDCQLICPWNKYAKVTVEPDFASRHGLDHARLIDLFGWNEATYLDKTEGMALRRAGHESWLRNIAIALGNAAYAQAVVDALNTRLDHPSEVVREHVQWALAQQEEKRRKANGILP